MRGDLKYIEGDDRKKVALYLHRKGGLTQEQVGDLLQIATSRANELIKDAERRWLRLNLVFTPSEEERIRKLTLGKELNGVLTKLQGNLQRAFAPFHKIIVIEPFPGDGDSLGNFATAAAPHVAQQLQGRSRIGVGWGSTTAALTDAIRELATSDSTFGSRDFRESDGKKFVVPIAAEPVGGDLRESATRVAATLAEALWRDRGLARSLAGIPAYVPKGDDRAALWRYVRRIRSYNDVLGGTEPKVDSLDAIVTSVAPSKTPWGKFSNELLSSNDLNASDLKELVIGDISGCLVERPNLKASDLDRLKLIIDGCTGIKKETLRKIASNGGVTILAIGAGKAEICYEAVQEGLCNELIVDGSLAERLLEYVPAGSRSLINVAHRGTSSRS